MYKNNHQIPFVINNVHLAETLNIIFKNYHLQYIITRSHKHLEIRSQRKKEEKFLPPDFGCFCAPDITPGSVSFWPMKQFSGKRWATFNKC